MHRLLRNTLLAVSLVAGTANARSEKSFAYPRDQAWPTAVRFVRVDEGLKIIEKDQDAGYLLFELKDDGKIWKGSLEAISTLVDGRPIVKFVITIEDRPSYLELGMLSRLQHKLRTELGTEAPAPSPKPKAPPPTPAKPEPPNAPTDGGPPISPTP